MQALNCRGRAEVPPTAVHTFLYTRARTAVHVSLSLSSFLVFHLLVFSFLWNFLFSHSQVGLLSEKLMSGFTVLSFCSSICVNTLRTHVVTVNPCPFHFLLPCFSFFLPLLCWGMVPKLNVWPMSNACVEGSDGITGRATAVSTAKSVLSLLTHLGLVPFDLERRKKSSSRCYCLL